MRSTGNDIVALGAIDRRRSNQIQFYSKILSVSEQALYVQQDFTDMPFENFVWLLWSVKESAYKYLKRLRPDLIFTPVKIIIKQLDPVQDAGWEIDGIGSSGKLYKGIVLFESGIYYFRSIIDEELIASVISDKERFEDTWWGIQSIDQSIGHIGYDQQSLAVRELVLQKLSVICALNHYEGHSIQGAVDHVRIGKSPLGYPVVLKGEEEMDIPVSLAHHDHFIAYSFVVPR